MLNIPLRLYYPAKRFLPRRLQLALRRPLVAHKLRKHDALWPINPATATPPPGWTGWPEGKRFALVLTHDVESQRGVDRVLRLAALEERLGFRSSFNFVAEDYSVPSSLREELEQRGFEVGLHGLTHDGTLYHSRLEFLQQATRINEILKDWQVAGFRSPSMYHNLAWLHDLDIEYDASTFDTDPFEPQPDALGTIFPMFIPNPVDDGGYVELPYTLPQDLHLFVLMQQNSIDIWKKKLRWLVENAGLVLVTTHPDYMLFENGNPACDEYPVERYGEFLEHVIKTYAGAYWAALPRQVARFWVSQFRPVHTPVRSEPSHPVPIHSESRHISPFSKEGFRGISSSHQPQAATPPVSPKSRKPLRVCMVAYTFYENDNRVKRYAETLSRHGSEVDVIALRRESQGSLDVDKGVKVYRVQKRVVNERSKLTHLLRLLAFFFRSSWVLTMNHLRQRYDLIHIHNIPDFEVFVAWVAKLIGAKIILDIHDILPEFYLSKFSASADGATYRLLQIIEKASCAFSDHVIISNHLWMKKLISRSVAASKCTTIINYPDCLIFQNPAENKSNDRLILLYPGSLNWHQGLDVAIKAFFLIKDQMPQSQFHIYGEGPEKESLFALVTDLGLDGRVIFHPFVAIEDIAGVMRESHLGIIPKRANGFGNEAFSTKILEFMALGVPVIVSDTQIDRFYFDESIVKFFKSDDENDLARSMLTMMKDPQLRSQYARNALRFVQNKRWTIKEHMYLELANKLLDTKNKMRIRALESETGSASTSVLAPQSN